MFAIIRTHNNSLHRIGCLKNSEKYRMGMGGGFYDYSLQFKRDHKFPITIGVAFDEQQNNDIIINEYDIKLDIVITPTRIL